MKKLFIIAGLAIAASACTRIETGEVGLRIGFDKQVSQNELLPGSFNQVILGDVITFPYKDVEAQVNDIPVIAKDNSTMKDFDMSVIYSIEPSQVAELYSRKSKGFHYVGKGDTYLMFNYIVNVAKSAAYKAAREFNALDMNDNKAAMEAKIRDLIVQALRDEKLDTSIPVNQVLIRSILPADAVTASANELVRAKNEQAKKEVEVKIAEAESRRMAALTNQSAQSIEYMRAQALLNISEGVRNGKVNTIVVPSDFKGMINTK